MGWLADRVEDLPGTKEQATNVAKVTALAAGAYFAYPLAASTLASAGTYASAASKLAMSSMGAGAAAGTAGMLGGLTTKGALLGGGLSLAGGLMSGSAAKDAAKTNSNAQIAAAQIAADAAKFRPVGVTNRFGSSNFQYDQNGNLVGAGYNASPMISGLQAQVERPMQGFADQFSRSATDNRGLSQGATASMNLGNQYLTTSPQAQAKKYLDEQLALLNPERERSLSGLMTQLRNQGRQGLAVGGTSDGMRASNPELEAYYNALLTQDRQLAADATLGGQQYAQFGQNMVGAGGNMMSQYYQNQSGSADPLMTALNVDTGLEGLAQNPMDIGINIGAKGTAASAASGALLAKGMSRAGNLMQPANAYNPWAYATGMMGSTISDMYGKR